MKIEDYRKTTKELQEEIKNNNNKFIINIEKAKIAYKNQFEFKAMETFGFAQIPFILFALFEVITKSGIANTFPISVLPLIISTTSLGIGFIGRKILERKNKIKERFKSFSLANTDSEKLQEEVKYYIECKKANNRNLAIRQAMTDLNSNQVKLNSLSDKYDFIDKTIPQNKEEAQKRIINISNTLKEQYDELDILTTKKVLNQKFWKIRNKYDIILNTIICAIIGGVFTYLFFNMPYLFTKAILIPNNLVFFAPLIIGIIGTTGYMLKRNKDYEMAFNNLNNKLGKNALPEINENINEELQNINTKIDSKTKEISDSIIQLQEQKRFMESLQNSEKASESSNLKKQTISPILNNGIDMQIEKKDDSLVLRKKIR